MRVGSKTLMRLCGLLFVMPLGGAALAAGSEADFKAAYAAADAAEKQAGPLRNQWLADRGCSREAKKAAEKSDFDQAIAAAKEAEALGQGLDLPGDKRERGLEKS